MRAVIQRVKSARVSVEGKTVGSIDAGLLIFVGVMDGDSEENADLLAQKTVNLRIFCDSQGKMNKSLLDIDGEALAVSQFTLCANNKKGNRPSFSQSAPPDIAKHLYDRYVKKLSESGVKKTDIGVFGADMQVSLVNDGPVTIIFDTDEWKGRC